MARVMGVDHGTRRIGIALSDEAGVIAMPLCVIPGDDAAGACSEICRLASEHKADSIVVGMPYNMDGSSGQAVAKVERFIGMLREKCGAIAVESWDERMTTGLVERTLLESDASRMRRRDVKDKLAAQAILQGYLDRMNIGTNADDEW